MGGNYLKEWFIFEESCINLRICLIVSCNVPKRYTISKMKNLIPFILIFILISCQKKHETIFQIIEDFNAEKIKYRTDTIQLENISSEGGELISYHNNSDKLCLDFFIYGETGKLNYTYFTDKKLNILFVIKRNYRYDSPITEENLKVDSIINYIYYQKTPKLYDENGDVIENKILTDSISLEIKEFLKETMSNNVKINK